MPRWAQDTRSYVTLERELTELLQRRWTQQRKKIQCINLDLESRSDTIRAKLPKSGKLEKSKKSHNFLKIVAIVVDFFFTYCEI